MEVRKKLSEINISELEYKELLDRKVQLIKESNLHYAEELYSLSEKEGEIQAYVKELNEAIEAGKYAKGALNNAEKSLDSASSWGTWDMLGGGAFSTVMKHSKMDEASNHIHVAQVRMRNFQKELLDIHEMIQVDMDVSGLLKFADFFFDNVIVDWIVQRQINDSLDRVIIQFNNVEKIVNTLEDELINLEEKLSEVKDKRRILIESL